MRSLPAMHTRIVPVDIASAGNLEARSVPDDILDQLFISLGDSDDAHHIRAAAEQLKIGTVPVAFPTETVYGLGADATRSDAVKGIFAAKQRPSDNPLIVHFSSLRQLRDLLRPAGHSDGLAADPIPEIYHPLIRKFWPGPLTIILPTPAAGGLAAEVTAGLDTFGARIPRHQIALALISLAGVPIAAPSANASTKPSPTEAEHVAADLDGRIETIIDGGPCAVGVESTVVDGLSSPPVVLRPGGISIDQLRSCPGWEDVKAVYRDSAEKGYKPRAPGMKYRHYSPKAPVLLYEGHSDPPSLSVLQQARSGSGLVGVIRTKRWGLDQEGLSLLQANGIGREEPPISSRSGNKSQGGFRDMLENAQFATNLLEVRQVAIGSGQELVTILDIDLGADTRDIARGIFGALRKLDQYGVEAIFVEGMDDDGDDLSAAIMNRLRKAAERTVA